LHALGLMRCVVRCGFKNKHQIDTYSKEIGLCAQNFFLPSIVNNIAERSSTWLCIAIFFGVSLVVVYSWQCGCWLMIDTKKTKKKKNLKKESSIVVPHHWTYDYMEANKNNLSLSSLLCFFHPLYMFTPLSPNLPTSCISWVLILISYTLCTVRLYNFTSLIRHLIVWQPRYNDTNFVNRTF
jgi:hypothetical protein